MKDIARTTGASIAGVTSSLFASNLPEIFQSIGETAGMISKIVSVGVGIVTLFYIYYKMQNEKHEYENNRKE